MNTIWTPELIQKLAKLWDEGHSTKEIGRRLGISKGAVVGKANRLHLTPRPSPIKKSRPKPVSTNACSWPTGHPGDNDFNFCGKRRLPGKPYCSEHNRMAYRP